MIESIKLEVDKEEASEWAKEPTHHKSFLRVSFQIQFDLETGSLQLKLKIFIHLFIDIKQ